MVDVARALDSGEPLDLLTLASTMLAVVDPRTRDPFERPDSESNLTIQELAESLIDIEVTETTALLAAIGALSDDPLLKARIRRELSGRAHRLPPWLAELDQTEATRAVTFAHVFGDGDNVMVEVQFPRAEPVTVLIYIDHNLSSVAKNAFVVPGRLDSVIEAMTAHVPASERADVAVVPLDLADAKVRIADAIAIGAMTVPRFESETWPSCRALVEWVGRLLPDGGLGYVRPDWGEDAVESLAERLFSSPFGARLDDGDHRDLLKSVLWFATDYGPGDPLRWSPTSIEIILNDWLPRKVVAPAAFLAKAPDLLDAFVRFCHHERKLRAGLTERTIEAIHRCAPEYQRTIRSPRPQGVAALFAAMGELDPRWPSSALDYGELLADDALGALADAVGGDEELDRLDERPLPDEPLVMASLSDDAVPSVAALGDLCDSWFDACLDAEHRTAARRLLARVAARAPDTLLRSARVEMTAAALCWISGKANDTFAPGPGPRVKDLMAHFGLSQSTPSSRATTILNDAGFQQGWDGAVCLGDPGLLTSNRRRRISEQRDRLRATLSRSAPPPG